VSEEDSGSWDEDAAGNALDVASGEEEDYDYGEDDYGEEQEIAPQTT